jgi:hypothetical protein
MLWEIYQQSRIRDASAAATRAESKAQIVTYTIDQLEDKIDSLALTCQSLWEILRDQTGLTEEELTAKVNEIDLRDGLRDGKMGSGGEPCTKCGRVLSKRHMRCMYCGEPVERQHAFQQ